jgi:hypothetical protein
MTLVLVGAGGVRAQTNGSITAGGFSAQVSVERTMVDERGKVIRELPGSRYRMERTADGRLRLTMLATRSYPTSGPLADAYAGLVVEQDGASGALRVLGKDGRPLPGIPALPASVVRTAVPAASDEGLIARVGALAARRAALTQTFGARVGAVRGLDRYVVKRGAAIEEVLVSPQAALPVEINVVEGGVLTERHQYDYEAQPDGALVRTRARSESRTGQGQERLVTVTTLSQVRIDGGAQ